MSLILGVDVGFVATGLVLIDVPASTIVACAVVRTERQAKKRGIRVADDDAERCCLLRSGVRSFYETYSDAWNPESHITGIVAELPSAGAQDARAARSMALATGAVVATIDEIGLPVEYVTPQMVKRVTGDKKATKEGVAAAVMARLPMNENASAKAAIIRGRARGLGRLEHVYDAAAAVLAAWDGNVVRMARQGREVGT